MIRTAITLTVFTVLMVAVVSGAERRLRFFGGLLMHERIRAQTYRDAIRERDEKVQELISIVKNPDVDTVEHGPLQSAISLLGVYRAREAVDPLVERLTFLPIRTSRIIFESRAPTQSWYPSTRALLEIGDASVNRLLYKIEFSDRKEERELAAWVIMQLQVECTLY
jgi:hypothetical protein